MVEMIEDGRTGWIASPIGSEGLAAALRRALGTPASTLADMGREAASSIRRLCDNGTIVQRQLEFRQRLIQRGAAHAIQAPPVLPGPQQAAPGEATDREARTPGGKGFGAVITCFNDGYCLDECLASVEHQTRKFVNVVIVDNGSTDEQTLAALDQAQRDGWCVIHTSQGGPASAKNAGLEWMRRSERCPLALAFLDAKDWRLL